MSRSKGEFYISIDCETFGPCPGIHSMVQFAAVFTTADGAVVSEFTRNLDEVPGLIRDPATMEWWKQQEIAFPGITERLVRNRVDPAEAFADFTREVERLEKELRCRAVVAAYPAGFDFSFCYFYLCRFTGRSCVGFSCLDLKTLSMALMPGKGYRGFGKKDMPKEWFAPALKHTHNALDDAHEQAFLLGSMLKALDQLHGKTGGVTGGVSSEGAD